LLRAFGVAQPEPRRPNKAPEPTSTRTLCVRFHVRGFVLVAHLRCYAEIVLGLYLRRRAERQVATRMPEAVQGTRTPRGHFAVGNCNIALREIQKA
jgi:hypothetical protein